MTAAEYSTGQRFGYAYDRVGNRSVFTDGLQVHTYTYDAANRLTNADGQNYTWDANGNLLNDGTSSYSYNAANRLTAVTGSGTTSSYAYDGLGNRVAQTVGGVTTRYTLDVAGGLPEVLAATTGANTTRYMQVGGQVLAQQESGTWGYILPDHLGSVRQVANAAGQVTLAQSYTPYGEVLHRAGSASSAFAFTGEPMDVTGMVHLRARYYKPGQGGFTARDTWQGKSRIPSSLHRYQYAYNNPLAYVDPSGYCADFGPLAVGQNFIQECWENAQRAAEAAQNGNWAAAAAYASGTADDISAIGEEVHALNASMATVYNPNASWQERVQASTRVTIFALSFAPGPPVSRASGAAGSCIDDVARFADDFADDLVIVYRGTDRQMEQQIFQETEHLLSDRAISVYVEEGRILDSAYQEAALTHQQWIDIWWGSEDAYVQAHSAFGTELQHVFGLRRTMVSVTTRPEVARYFAGIDGVVYVGQVPRGTLIPQTLPGASESEFLIRYGSPAFRPLD